MIVRLQRLSNGVHVVTVPKHLVAKLKLEKGSLLEWRETNRKLVLEVRKVEK